MNAPSDRYEEWGAAYVLGALGTEERAEFEAHLAVCETCAAEVRSNSGVSSLLARLPAEEVMRLEHDGSGPEDRYPVPPTLLPSLLAAGRRDRTRARLRVGAWIGAAVAAVVIVLVSAALILDFGSEEGVERVTLQPTADSPLTADAELVEESGATRIDVTCRYPAGPTSADGAPATAMEHYGLYVTDVGGDETMVATWSAAPGSTSWPEATVMMPRDELVRLTIRDMDSGRTLLEADL